MCEHHTLDTIEEEIKAYRDSIIVLYNHLVAKGFVIPFRVDKETSHMRLRVNGYLHGNPQNEFEFGSILFATRGTETRIEIELTHPPDIAEDDPVPPDYLWAMVKSADLQLRKETRSSSPTIGYEDKNNAVLYH